MNVMVKVFGEPMYVDVKVYKKSFKVMFPFGWEVRFPKHKPASFSLKSVAIYATEHIESMAADILPDIENKSSEIQKWMNENDYTEMTI